jgi:hypothetical protein
LRSRAFRRSISSTSGSRFTTACIQFILPRAGGAAGSSPRVDFAPQLLRELQFHGGPFSTFAAHPSYQEKNRC